MLLLFIESLHMLKECQLHKEPSDNLTDHSNNRKQSPSQKNIPTKGKVNLFSKSNLRWPFLQVFPVYVIDQNDKRFNVHTLLDSRLDSMVINTRQ